MLRRLTGAERAPCDVQDADKKFIDKANEEALKYTQLLEKQELRGALKVCVSVLLASDLSLTAD